MLMLKPFQGFCLYNNSCNTKLCIAISPERASTLVHGLSRACRWINHALMKYRFLALKGRKQYINPKHIIHHCQYYIFPIFEYNHFYCTSCNCQPKVRQDVWHIPSNVFFQQPNPRYSIVMLLQQ